MIDADLLVALRALRDEMDAHYQVNNVTGELPQTSARQAAYWRDKVDALLRRAGSPQTNSVDEKEATLRALASAMRKVLPKELFEQMLEYLDPLGSFLETLRARSAPPQSEQEKP